MHAASALEIIVYGRCRGLLPWICIDDEEDVVVHTGC